MTTRIVKINRAPVLTLWAAVVAERQGFKRAEALTLGKAVAGLNAQAKGRRLGIYRKPSVEKGRPKVKRGLGEEFWVEVCGRPVPAVTTKDGVRAVVGDKPIDPEAVERYLEQKFGEDLKDVRAAMSELALARKPADLAEEAYPLYERFRPSVPAGKGGWGAKGDLDLGLLKSLR